MFLVSGAALFYFVYFSGFNILSLTSPEYNYTVFNHSYGSSGDIQWERFSVELEEGVKYRRYDLVQIAGNIRNDEEISDDVRLGVYFFYPSEKRRLTSDYTVIIEPGGKKCFFPGQIAVDRE